MIVEIHALDAGHQHRRDADHRSDGQDLEQVILLGGDEAQIRIQQELDLVGEVDSIFVQRLDVGARRSSAAP